VLILSRREAECIILGDDIVLTIVAVGNDKVRIGVKAPPEVRILRSELDVQDNVHEPTIAFPVAAAIKKSSRDEKSTSHENRRTGRRAA